MRPATERHGYASSDGVRIHYVEQGPDNGRVVLMMHGFPEVSYSWRHQLPVLAAAGYRAVAIDVRGYGRSGKPWAIDDYRMLRHVADNVAVAAHLGTDKAIIVGQPRADLPSSAGLAPPACPLAGHAAPAAS